ncbi:uncharacterized protein PGTG_04108 [Puccinia graminis f. sp. tritici CRL 75-36-700-3]|uniref:Uncharacterized protein n=1 Tax=Puccinia graminis f. sp. tritici (strain CRL 75-36-700-3 / race SCCL) TaxID=418459 RepID=E3K1H7_PUCGT|nr:uncharacterized protein PGTG_04108 [Puccinia graminis f. sp. tritici CRL 75-36-700-3]EFP78152.2 hypothetical protein PGTG_04108 [Puccinia graminis f. sp. tritici CRL 75-36-700-3]
MSRLTPQHLSIISSYLRHLSRFRDPTTRWIAAANSGHVNVYETLLKEASARAGERRKEFMKLYLEMVPGIAKEELLYPLSELPSYLPALVALLSCPDAYLGQGRPSIGHLQSIPPGTLINNTWSDLPPNLQSAAPPIAAHMGLLHEARQINKRRWLRDRWLAGLIGPVPTSRSPR